MIKQTHRLNAPQHFYYFAPHQPNALIDYQMPYLFLRNNRPDFYLLGDPAEYPRYRQSERHPQHWLFWPPALLR